MNQRFIRVIHHLNLPREVCHHLMGKDHHITHRMLVGAVVMAGGVAISRWGFGSELALCHAAADMVGYGIHGMGLIPFAEYAIVILGE